MLLDSGLIRHWGNCLNTILQRNLPRIPRHHWLSLQMHVHSLLLCLLLLGSIVLHSAQKFVSGPRMVDVLDSDVHSLLNVSVADLFVNDDPHRISRDVVDHSSLAVIHFVGHAEKVSVRDLGMGMRDAQTLSEPRHLL